VNRSLPGQAREPSIGFAVARAHGARANGTLRPRVNAVFRFERDRLGEVAHGPSPRIRELCVHLPFLRCRRTRLHQWQLPQPLPVLPLVVSCGRPAG